SLSNGGHTAPWWQYDYLAYYIQHNRRLYDDLVGPAVIIICVFFIVSLKGLYFMPVDGETWQMIYDLVVRITDSYDACRQTKQDVIKKRSSLSRNFQAKPDIKGLYFINNGLGAKVVQIFYQVKVEFLFWVNLGELNRAKFALHQDAIKYSSLSVTSRIKLIVLTKWLDHFVFWSTVALSKFSNFGKVSPIDKTLPKRCKTAT